MSPEQCRGKATLDRRSDVFSIGTILYELTTGRLPFTDETEYGILDQIANRDAEPPSQLVAGFSPALEAIVMRALARDLEQRYATALEMQKDIEGFAHENRLQISPLVLARLMGTLYPTRLEEWDHARAQGAFFVEQHVLRTLIENRRGDDAPPPPDPDEDVTKQTAANDTAVGPPPIDESTNVRERARSPRASSPSTPPPPRASSPSTPPPSRASSPSTPPPSRPSSSSLPPPPRASSPSTPPPPRASSPVLAAAPPASRQSEPTLRVPTASTPPPPQGFPVVAPAEPIPPAPSRMVTPLPGRLPSPPSGRMSSPVLVPGQPGAVPIVTAPVEPPPPPPPPMALPGVGAPVTSHALGSIPPLTHPVADELGVTERVRARAEVVPGETALVKVGRSRTPMFILAGTGVLAAVVAGILVFSGGKQEAGASRPAAVEPATATEPSKPDPDEADPSAGEGPATAAAGDPAEPGSDEPARADDGAAGDPAKVKAGDPPEPKRTRKRSIRQSSRGKTRGTKSEKESKWAPDSPFMPVRSGKK